MDVERGRKDEMGTGSAGCRRRELSLDERKEGRGGGGGGGFGWLMERRDREQRKDQNDSLLGLL